MIAASHDPYEARFRHENNGRPHFSTKPVIAWDDDGCALVPDEKTGRLREASSYSNFAGLAPADAPVIGTAPGGGWSAEHRTDNGDTEATPVLAWLVHADGSLTPTIADIDGLTDDPTTASNFVRLHPPTELP
ncbi:hypothetical protein ACFWDI_35765 [Streptomyces sp. NPDC060064]|uniref:hypothetical protein n=1 Tax=Streptomyces sp. NPDC060064 TaxID=3347049 RepID=UPI0036BD17E6